MISAAQLLSIWEQGLSQTHVQRALTLLTALYPQATWHDLANLSIGQRDRRLMALREMLFGSHINGLATCPKCAEQLDLNFEISDICVPETANANTDPIKILIDQDGWRLTCRLPNSADLLGLTAQQNNNKARRALVQACIVSIEQDDSASLTNADAHSHLPDTLITAMARKLQMADPQGDVQLTLTCVRCKHEWLMPFDIVSYLWAELHDWARRLLHEVHSLAFAYGWRETDILAMSAHRRKLYLQMLGV